MLQTLKLVDILLINDTRSKMLAGESNLPRAAQKVWHGSAGSGDQTWRYGATIFFRGGALGLGIILFARRRIPIEEVV